MRLDPFPRFPADSSQLIRKLTDLFRDTANMRQTARFHRFKVDTTGDYTVTAFRPEWVERGRR